MIVILWIDYIDYILQRLDYYEIIIRLLVGECIIQYPQILPICLELMIVWYKHVIYLN